MPDVRAQLRRTSLRQQLSMGTLSFLGAYIAVLSIRFVAAGSWLIMATAAAEMLVWYLSLHTFEDWRQFKGLAPISILTTLMGTATGMQWP